MSSLNNRSPDWQAQGNIQSRQKKGQVITGTPSSDPIAQAFTCRHQAKAGSIVHSLRYRFHLSNVYGPSDNSQEWGEREEREERKLQL